MQPCVLLLHALHKTNLIGLDLSIVVTMCPPFDGGCLALSYNMHVQTHSGLRRDTKSQTYEPVTIRAPVYSRQ